MPFTVDQFFQIFANYNESVWPSQIVFYLLALASIGFVFQSRPTGSRVISLVLAFFWLWMGIIYHFAFFSRINPAALAFGTGFVIQGLIFLWIGVFRGKIRFRPAGGVAGMLGWGLVFLALFIYPVVGLLVGQRYPAFPTFGLHCPTTIFSIGMLVFTTRPRPKSVLVVPALWTVIGSYAAFNLGVIEDLSLVLAGVVGFGMMLQELTGTTGSHRRSHERSS